MLLPRSPRRPLPLRLRAAVAALALALAGCGDGERADFERDVAAGVRPRNVILFLVDTLRADRLGCYGYARQTSPYIDQLASRGTLYRQNFAQGCWTLPSMLSLMSGLYVFDEEQQLPKSTQSLPELLARADVYTAAFIGNDVLVHDRGFDRGFDHFEGPVKNGSAANVVDRFQQWWTNHSAELAEERGFFAWLHTMDPHDPYDPAQKFRAFDGQELPNQAELVELWETRRAEAERLARPDAPSFAAAVELMVRDNNLYDGEVRAVDYNLQKLVNFLSEQGELERTLIIIAADHGEKLYEHPHYPQEPSLKVAKNGGLPRGLADLFAVGHRSWFQDELWNTPLILCGPGAPAGKTVEGLTENLDIFPTVLDAFALEPPGWLPGKSLLGGADPGRARVFGYGYYTTAVREAGGHKLIEHYPERFLLDEEAPAPLELLDLARDPSELRDLSSEQPLEAERLAGVIGAWREDVEREFSTEFTKRNMDALRKLGYVGDQ